MSIKKLVKIFICSEDCLIDINRFYDNNSYGFIGFWIILCLIFSIVLFPIRVFGYLMSNFFKLNRDIK